MEVKQLIRFLFTGEKENPNVNEETLSGSRCSAGTSDTTL